MNATVKCCFCNSALENTESIKILRSDSIFLKKYSLICSDCKGSNVSAQLTQINKTVDAISDILKQVITDSETNCNRIYSLECKLGSLSSSFDHMAGATDNIADGISHNTRTLAHNNASFDKFATKMSNFVDNFEYSVNQAVNAKLDLIIPKLNTSISQLTLSNQRLSDNIELCKSATETINQHLRSKPDDIARLSKTLKNTMDSCNELSNSLSISKPIIVKDILNNSNIQQELSFVDAGVISVNQLSHQNQTASSNMLVRDMSFTSNIRNEVYPADASIILPNSPSQLVNSSTRDNLIVDPPSAISPVINSNNNFSALKAAPASRCIFVSRLDISTKHSEVLSHIKSIIALHNINVDFDLIKCLNISRFNGIVASFKITVPESLFHLLISPTSWPTSTFIKEFHNLANVTLKNATNISPKN